MRYSFTPLNKTKIKLFANSGEAVVFWLALAGIIFLAIVSFYRAYHMQKIIDQYNEVSFQVNPLILSVEHMIAVTDSLQHRTQYLSRQVDSLKNRHINIERSIRKGKQRPATTSSPNAVYLPR